MSNYDPEKKCLAVIAESPLGTGIVLWTVGGDVVEKINELGNNTFDLALVPPSYGVWVWEGKYVLADDETETDEFGPLGEFRRPTEEEWIAIREGRCPWNDEEWKVPS